MTTYLLRDLGGNSNSPTEMVSMALRDTLVTCWHCRLRKLYLQIRRDQSVMRTRRSFSLFQWSILVRKHGRAVGVGDWLETLPSWMGRSH